MRRYLHGATLKSLAAGLMLLLPAPALGQTAADSLIIEQQQRQIEQQFEQQRTGQLRQLRQQAPLPKRDVIPRKPDPDKTGECLDIERIKLTGMTVFSQQTLRSVIADYEQRCLFVGDIKALLTDMTQLYIKNGYVAARVFLQQPVDVLDGVLELVVAEGTLEGIETNRNHQPRGGADTPFVGLTGKPINLFALESSLEQINRLPSYQATMALKPGEQEGASTLVVDIASPKRWRAHVGIDNAGNTATGKKQMEWSAGIDDVFGLYESLDFTLRHDGERHTPSTLSRQFTVRASVPYGRWQGRYLGSHYEYRSRVEAVSQTFQTSGHVRSHTVELERLLHRTAGRQTAISLALTHKNTKNFLEGLFLRASSRKLSIAGVSLTHRQQNLWGGTFGARASFERGLKLFGAKADRSITRNTPQAQFLKAEVELDYGKSFKSFGETFIWQSRLNGQWTPDTLYGSERLNIGGQYTVRGFDEQSLSGDVGGYMRSDLIYPIAINNSQFTRITGKWQAYAGLDAGWLRRDNSEAYERGVLGGMALGMRSSGGLWFTDVSYERRLKAPAFLEEEGGIFRVRLGVKL